MSDTPTVKGSPEHIWLVYGDIDQDCTHYECDEVTWCEDEVYSSDVGYVRGDIHDRLRARVAELEDERSRVALAAEDATEYVLAIANRDLRAEVVRLRAALEAAPTPTEPGAYNMGTVMQKEWYNFRHWFLTTRAEALK